MRTVGRSTSKVAGIALLAGAALGLVSFLAVRFLPQPANLVGTLGGPWLATAFAVGTFARDRATAAWAGAVSMAAAVAAYYVARQVIAPGAPGGITVRGEAIPYLVIGIIAGAGMAILGSAWRTSGTRWRAVAAGVLAGALGAEVIVLSSRSWRGRDLVFAILQGAAAILVAWFLPRSLRGRVLATIIGVGSAAVVGGAILALDLPLRLFP